MCPELGQIQVAFKLLSSSFQVSRIGTLLLSELFIKKGGNFVMNFDERTANQWGKDHEKNH